MNTADYSKLEQVKYSHTTKTLCFLGIVFLLPPLAIYILSFLAAIFEVPFAANILDYISKLPIVVLLLALLAFPFISVALGIIAKIKNEHPKLSTAIIIVGAVLVGFFVYIALRSS